MNKDNNYKRDLLQIQHKLNILDQKCITLSWQNAAMSQIMVDKQLCTNEELNAYMNRFKIELGIDKALKSLEDADALLMTTLHNME